MIKSLILAAAFLITVPAIGATTSDKSDTPAPRISLFSTSTDWQAVTGLTLNEYRGEFKTSGSKLIGRGLVLYYLDGFPCYGLGDSVRVWLGPGARQEGRLRIACVHAPSEIKFAWRNAARDADQAQSTGIITCPVTGDRDFTIDMSRCSRGPDWDTYK